MNKLYNTQEQIARKIKKILLEVNPDVRKTQMLGKLNLKLFLM